MSFDGFYTHALTQELREHLLGGRIGKIYQPFLQELQLVIRANRTNYRLHGSIHPTYYRLHITEDRANNPKQAPLFSMLTRKHLEGAIIEDIRQIDNDRVIVFELSGRDEIGIEMRFHLMYELMGRHSNIVLVNPDTNKIIDSIKHVPAAINSYRTLQAGAEYRLPPSQDKQVNLFNLSQEELSEFAQANEATIRDGKAHQVIQGLSRLGKGQIETWIDQGMTITDALSQFIQLFQEPQGTIYQAGDKLQYYAVDLPYLEGERHTYDSLSASLDAFYREKVHLDRIKQMSGNLIQQLEHHIQRNETKLQRLEEDRQVAQAADTYRLYGELLSAFAYQIDKGMTETVVTSYYDNQPVTIPLDPRKNAIENSQTYYKKYGKYRDSLKYIDHQQALARQEIDYLETILVQVGQADLEDIEDIKDELRDGGYLKQTQKNLKKRAKSKSRPRRYRSSDDVIIYVGRNNQQNDQLSMRKSPKNHWWLHTKDIPGAHVIIESDNPSEETFTEAAEIAAYHSKSQNSANVPVDTVQVKHLRKPNGAKPGFVIYEGQRTLFVTPVESKVQAMEIKD